MIDRFDVSCTLDYLKSGRYVLYEDHLEAIAEKDEEMKSFVEHHEAQTEDMRAEIESLKKDLALNASMLAKQCDLAREAEIVNEKQSKL